LGGFSIFSASFEVTVITMTLLDQIFKTNATDYTYGPITDVPDNLPHAQIEKGSAYISILLRSMRIVSVRRGWNKFYPVVHSYISIPHLGGKRAELQAVTSPSKLSELDASHLDRVISLNHRLLGPIPYRGGDINLEVGLFSVKSDDLAKPFLGVLEAMAAAAGVSYLSVAMPFVGPLKKGLEFLTGSNDIDLEIGLCTVFSKPETGYFFVMRAERGSVNPADLKVAEDFRLVDRAGQAISDYPYLVFSIETSDRRDEWFLIPEIASLHEELSTAIRKGKENDVQEIFSLFRRTVLTSPDLLAKDAQRLVKEVEEEITAQLPAAMTSVATRSLRPLHSIALFDEPNPGML
jgi:hypothetical protein